MAIEMRQQMKLTQQLVMTPQLQQAIKLLQLSRLELQDLVRQEMEENPVLEESPEIEETKEADQLEMQEDEDLPKDEKAAFEEVKAGEETLQDIDWATYLDGYNYSVGDQYYDDDDRPSYENILTKKSTLFDHLLWQLKLGHFAEEELPAGVEILGNIDEDGYFRATVADVAAECGVCESLVETVLCKIQGFDPMGIAARNLQECLLIQVRQLGMSGSLVEVILQDHLKDLETRKYKQIAKALGIDFNEVLATAKIISGLDPKPGRQYNQDDVQYISPDIFVQKVGDEFVVMLNDEGLPNIKINPYYAVDSRSPALADSKTEEYINDKMRSALWLIKSIHQRQRTIYKAAKSIVKFQRDFLEHGIEHLKPLVLRDVAEDIGMHESTISRVTTNKYMQTPQGLLELKYFFNSGISTIEGDPVASESVKNRIREIVDKEDLRRPYSDQRIAEILSRDNITIARRTVTKYREMLKIGSSSERKRLF
ncbi:MAG TPA: RNA polymerase factor sigma-54 [Geobacteraceae bacterium]|jgi:RNA polymerase sigma-54 factor|nr:RNA polymerase factor sigma-54 [Geobacteraceae bacterium]